MAQETAGTIGIPALKNEVLPYLADYARRRERAEAAKATQEYRAALLAQKKLEQQEKFALPEMTPAGGNYFSNVVDKNVRDRLGVLKGEVASGKRTQGELVSLHRAADMDTKRENNLSEFQTKKMDEKAKQLQEYGINATPGLLQQYVNESYQKAPENFLGQNHPDMFEAFALSNSANINPAAIGAKAMADQKESELKIERGGKTTSMKYYPIFKTGTKKAPTGESIVAATDVDIPAAQMLIDRDSKLQKVRDAYITSEASKRALSPEYMALPENVRQQKATEDATKKFYEEAFRPYRREAYGVTYESKGRGGAGRQSPYKDISVSSSFVSIPSASGVTAKVPTMSITPTRETQLDINLPVGKMYVDITKGGAPAEIKATGNYILSPNIGWAAKKKGTNEYIPASQWSKYRLQDVELVPGMYGTLSAMQAQQGKPDLLNPTAPTYRNPSMIKGQVFIEEGQTGNFETLAENVLRDKKSSYDAVKKRLMKETEKKFMQTRFRTQAK
jgi:hypothetical protein